MLFRSWPLILVSLGGEMIVSNIRQEGEGEIMKYDKGAVLLMLLLACFAVGMGMVEYFMEYYQQYGAVYY